MKVLVSIIRRVLGTSLALLDATLASNADLGSTLALHLLERVASRSNEETEKVDLREFLDRNVDFVLRTGVALCGMVVSWRLEGRVELEGLVDEFESLFLELLAVSNFTRVCSATVSIVSGRRRR